MVFDAGEVREDFPVLDRRVKGHPIQYLDNAPATHTSERVYDISEEGYAGYSSNIHSGVRELSHEASIAKIAGIDGLVADALLGRYPDVRRECVEGFEDVIREPVREYVDTGKRAGSSV